jgi:hypothetical protein
LGTWREKVYTPNEFQRKVKRLYAELEPDSSENPGFPIGFIHFHNLSDGRPHPLSISFFNGCFHEVGEVRLVVGAGVEG